MQEGHFSLALRMTRSEKEMIINAISPSIEVDGYDCVDIDWNEGDKTLSVFIAKRNGEPIGIDDCVAVNHLLDGEHGIERFIPGEFVLEVSSPGIEPPLRTAQHFTQHIGAQVNVKLDEKVEDRLAGRGTLVGISETGVIEVETSRGSWQFPINLVKKAHVVYTE